MGAEADDELTGQLRQAVQNGSPDRILELVRRGAEVNHRDECGETALTYATSIGLGPVRAVACVRCLLELGARVAEERPDGGLGTSIHQAAGNGYTEALGLLLAVDCAVALELFDDMSRTPLILAVEKGHIREAQMLLAAGANVDTHDEARIGDTALIEAIQARKLECVELLLRHGANPTLTGWMRLDAVDHFEEWEKEGTTPALVRVGEHLRAAARKFRDRSNIPR